MTAFKNTSGDYTVTCANGTGMFTINGYTTLTLPNYTYNQVANLATPVTGQLVYVSNGDSGDPCLAVYNGTDWRRVVLGATIAP